MHIPCSVSDFAAMYANKLGLNADVLRKTMWGDFYLNAKAKRIFRGAQVRVMCSRFTLVLN